MYTVKRAYKTTTTPHSLRRVYALPRKAALTHCIPAAVFIFSQYYTDTQTHARSHATHNKYSWQ